MVAGELDAGGATVVGGTITVVEVGATVVDVGDTEPSPGGTNNEYANKLGLPAPTLDTAPAVAADTNRCST